MEKEVSRLYIENVNNKKIKKFLNIVALYSGTELTEFKFTFEGLPKKGNWFHEHSASVDFVKGFRKRGKLNKLQRGIEVGFHRDGNIMYKSGTNFKPQRHLPFNKISSPEPFLRIGGFSLSSLEPASLGVRDNEAVLPLNGFGSHTPVACNLYISRGAQQYSFEAKDKKHFKDSQTIFLHDEQNDFSFHLHFHESANLGQVVVMIQRKLGPVGRISRSLRYYWYELIDFLTVQK